MIDKTVARVDIINTTISLINVDIDFVILKKSTSEYLASLYSSLSSICDDIDDIYLLSKNTIKSEYFDYMEDLRKEKENSLSQYAIESMSSLSRNLKSAGEDFDDESIGSKMNSLSSKISSMLNFDIQKESTIRPILSSRSEDLIISLKQRLAEYTLKVSTIKKLIIDSCIILESISFIQFMIDRNAKNKINGIKFIRLLPSNQFNEFIISEYNEYIKKNEVS